MSLKDFIRKSKKQYRKHGTDALPPIAGDFVASAASKIPYLGRMGRKIYDHEWDVILILDACRTDMYRDVVRTPTEEVWMSGASSPEFMENNYSSKYADEMKETAFVTGNPFSEEYARGKFGKLDEAWSHSWDEDLGTMPPGPIRDRTIHYHREGWDRVIGHFMQPHYPFIGHDGDDMGKVKLDHFGGDSVEEYEGPWMAMFYNREYDMEDLRYAYWKNLEYVWSYVQDVIDNVNGKVVVTSDHGNAMGEWGLWGHQPGFLHPQMRRVPWDVYQATDSRSYEPEIEETDIDSEVEDRLSQLGYK